MPIRPGFIRIVRRETGAPYAWYAEGPEHHRGTRPAHACQESRFFRDRRPLRRPDIKVPYPASYVDDRGAPGACARIKQGRTIGLREPLGGRPSYLAYQTINGGRHTPGAPALLQVTDCR
jgi:hypothetical protein